MGNKQGRFWEKCGNLSERWDVATGGFLSCLIYKLTYTSNKGSNDLGRLFTDKFS